jgi:hypothetical protein
MSSRNKIIWIDDYPNRAVTAKDLGAEFINVNGKDLGPVVKKLLNDPAPQLIIIDHVLDKVASATNPVFAKGSTIAEAIKEKWPSCPVIGITAADVTGIDRRTKGVYDALFSSHQFSKYFDRIRGIANGFKLIATKHSDVAKLIRLLKPPREELQRLRAAFTDDPKGAPSGREHSSRMYRWVERLMDRPGFLFDQLWSAALLGLNETGFDTVAPLFEGAKYDGVFTRPDEPRWWSSRLSELLYKRCPPNPGELSWHVGRRLPGIDKRHFSSCYYCNEEFPETVAFFDEASPEHQRAAMHLRCTNLHSLYRRELYFEDIRVMRGN